MTKIEELKQLNEMLDQTLITQQEYDKLRSELLLGMSSPRPQMSPPLPPMDNIGRTFGIPAEPGNDQTVLRDPRTGDTMTIKKWPPFWLSLFFGCFYFAYHGLWLHAALALVAAVFTSCLSWLIYPFFAYRLVVDKYQRQGWVVISPPPLPVAASAY